VGVSWYIHFISHHTKASVTFFEAQYSKGLSLQIQCCCFNIHNINIHVGDVLRDFMCVIIVLGVVIA